MELKGLNGDAMYEFTDVDTGKVWQMTGEQAKAFSIVIKGQRESKLIRYCKAREG